MIRLLLATIFFMSCITKGQTNLYFYEYSVNNQSENLVRGIQVLQIDFDGNIKFYDERLLEFDSINQHNSNIRVSKVLSRFGQELTRNRLYSKTKNYKLRLNEYYVFDTQDSIAWKVTLETRAYHNYTLQKAIGKFGGKEWEAWFCKEIPINEGPFKFRGLPGLIFEIYDNQRKFHYLLIQNKQVKNLDTSKFLETFYGLKPLQISTQSYKNKIMEYYKNPFVFDSSSFETMNADEINEYNKETQEELRRSELLSVEPILFAN